MSYQNTLLLFGISDSANKLLTTSDLKQNIRLSRKLSSKVDNGTNNIHTKHKLFTSVAIFC